MKETMQEPQDERNAALIHALETPPNITAPQDFAARVMARIPQQSQPQSRFAHAALTPPGYGRRAIFVALGLLLVLMLVITPATRTSSTWMTFQLVLLAQFSIFVLWIGVGKLYSR